MQNREKVISEFERWIDWMDEDCPQIAIDAISLLKEPEAVVRCKDCNYYCTSESVDDSGFCRHLKLNNPPYWYCYDGWRKKDA